MSSKETSRSSRRTTRATATGSSSSSSQNSSTSRPVRSTRLKNNQINLAESSSSNESDSEDIKPIETVIYKRTKLNGTAATTSASSSKIDADSLAKLESITGLSRSEAMQLLEASNNKLEQAIELHFSNLNGATTSHKSNGKRTINHVEESNSCDSIYNSDDNVRAPIQPKSEKMLDYDPYSLTVEPQAKRVRSAFDGYRPGEEGLPSSSHSSKAKSLAALYKPPVELLFRGSFDASKVEGCKKNRWIMLNVQDQSDFACQCLNRDLWREDAVKEIIKANFIFVQVYFDSLDGKKMINYYRITNYPFIAVLDPRTGENVLQFTNTSKMDQFLFCEKVTNFLCEHDVPIKDFEENGKADEIVQIDDEDSKDCVVVNEPKTIKASELIKELNGEDDNENSNSSEESVKLVKNKASNKNRLESSDDESVEQKPETVKHEPKMLRYETPGTEKRDCVIRILYPNGDRLDFCTNGDSKFKELAEYLKKQGYKKKTHELIERLMPNIKPSQSNEISLSQTTIISNDLSNLIITNQSRNLFSLENDQSVTFKELNLFPRVFLLLQEY